MPIIPTEGQNTGLLIRPPSPTDWVAGAETGMSGLVIEPTGQFDVYLPDEESQFMPPAGGANWVFDSSACVSCSGLNKVETLLNRMIANGTMPATHFKFLKDNGYISFSGKVNLSDRFTAKMSGTTKQGNYLDAVGDSIRTLHGVVPEGKWPFPRMDDLPGDANNDARWNRYYAEVPQDVQALGRKFLTYFKINREWILLGQSDNAKLREYLKRGPIQIAAKICSPWNSNEGMAPIKACGCDTGHATMLYGFTADGSLKLFDSYKSYRKLLADDYCIQWAVQYTAVPLALGTPSSFKYNFKQNLVFGMAATAEVRKLQEALQFLKRGNGQPYMKAGTFGPFGPATKTALGLFQTDHGIPDPSGQGTNFGPSTRAKMNPLVA